MNHRILLVIAAAALFARSVTAQSVEIPLVPNTQAERHGLKRAWFSQIPLDVSKSRISYVTLQSGLLMVTTDEGMLFAINPETGLVLWSYQVGEPRFVTLAAGANDKYVGVVNATYLHLLDRASGGLIWKRELTGVPSRGPVLTENQICVPLALGPVEVYPLNEPAEKVL